MFSHHDLLTPGRASARNTPAGPSATCYALGEETGADRGPTAGGPPARSLATDGQAEAIPHGHVNTRPRTAAGHADHPGGSGPAAQEPAQSSTAQHSTQADGRRSTAQETPQCPQEPARRTADQHPRQHKQRRHGGSMRAHAGQRTCSTSETGSAPAVGHTLYLLIGP